MVTRCLTAIVQHKPRRRKHSRSSPAIGLESRTSRLEREVSAGEHKREFAFEWEDTSGRSKRPRVVMDDLEERELRGEAWRREEAERGTSAKKRH